MARKKEIIQQSIPAAPVKKAMPLIDEDLSTSCAAPPPR
jgi:hypothetical protein